MHGIEHWPRHTMAVAGSSLGGFYARWLALKTGCRSVLLNPAVFPARDLARHIGEQTAWHDPQERFHFEPGFVAELQAQQDAISLPLRDAFALIAMGDEVLDWREMVSCYPGVRLKLLVGSDHALSDFDDHIDEVVAHLQLG